MVGTPRGVAYVPMVGTYGPPIPGLPYVPMVGTGCTHGGYGILFFAGVAAGGIGERFAIPFLEISGWRMRPVSEIGETIVRRDSATIVAEEAFRCLAEEAVVLVFGIPAHNRIFGFGADRFCRTATSQVRFPVVRSIVAQPSSQLDPQQPGSRRHGAPGRCGHDCLGDRHKRPVALSFALHAVLLALA